MLTVLLILTIILLLTLAFLLYRKRKSQHGVFKELGIPGPEPHWLYGNLEELRGDGRLPCTTLRQWSQKYGKIYGYYEGPMPILVSSDLEFLQQVFVKKFSHFHGRKLYPIQPPPESPMAHMLLSHGQKWKRLRMIINPTFSSAKLKGMMPIVGEKVKILLQKLSEEAENGVTFNIMEFYQRLTLDVIGDAAFGMNFDPQNNPNSPFLESCRKMFDNLDPSKRMLIFVIAQLLPELRGFFWNVFNFLKVIFKFPGFWLVSNLQKVIDARRKEKAQRTDLLQLMLDAEVDVGSRDNLSKNLHVGTENGDIVNGEKENLEDIFKIEKFEKKLSNREIASQSFLFLLAGYETTSTALSYTSHLLATHPEKQRKLQDEIDQHYPKQGELSYDTLHKMPYLNMVLSETLRMYPLAASVINRKCMTPCTISGLHIPLDMVIQPDVFGIHYSTDIWGPNASEFVPERFSKEDLPSLQPMAWIPFGAGPRNCVGLRFALMEAKLALVEILHKFTIESCSDTLEIEEKGVITPAHGVQAKLVLRN